MSALPRPALPVDATLDVRRKDRVYAVLSEESRLSVYSHAHLNKEVRRLNERRRKALGFEIPQHDPGAGNARGMPARHDRFARIPVARHRRNHQIEGVRFVRTM